MKIIRGTCGALTTTNTVKQPDQKVHSRLLHPPRRFLLLLHLKPGGTAGMTEAQKYVWQGAIPLRIHLHESEVTSHPPPPPAHVLAPRIGYLPLLLPLIKPYFCAALPPGHDSPWFEYRGLPLKWYIPTGVLFDLLCAEPERPWNLTVHFRGYPNILIPCEGEDSVKWSFINSLKEADYIVNGNCKNVMHMSQHDQVDLWRSVMDANLEAYTRASSKLKFGLVEDEYSLKTSLSSVRLPKTDKIPVRLYVLDVCEDFEDLEDVPEIACWDKISYMNRPLEILEAEDECFTLYDALKAVVPELFDDKPGIDDKPSVVEEGEEEQKVSSDVSCTGRTGNAETRCQSVESWRMCRDAKIKLVRIQGIEPRLDIPFSWVVNNLKNPEYFLHICIYVKL